jgi:exodeoxyribonuclease VII small subunit
MAETKTNQEMSIEETLEALEIIEKMEDRDSSLEETFANYELGMKMVKSCSDQIDRVEKKIQVLAEESRDGEF